MAVSITAQVGVRLPLHVAQKLQEQADARGIAATALATEILTRVISNAK